MLQQAVDNLRVGEVTKNARALPVDSRNHCPIRLRESDGEKKQERGEESADCRCAKH
jgi:hypothetical protein